MCALVAVLYVAATAAATATDSAPDPTAAATSPDTLNGTAAVKATAASQSSQPPPAPSPLPSPPPPSPSPPPPSASPSPPPPSPSPPPPPPSPSPPPPPPSPSPPRSLPPPPPPSPPPPQSPPPPPPSTPPPSPLPSPPPQGRAQEPATPRPSQHEASLSDRVSSVVDGLRRKAELLVAAAANRSEELVHHAPRDVHAPLEAEEPTTAAPTRRTTAAPSAPPVAQGVAAAELLLAGHSVDDAADRATLLAADIAASTDRAGAAAQRAAAWGKQDTAELSRVAAQLRLRVDKLSRQMMWWPGAVRSMLLGAPGEAAADDALNLASSVLQLAEQLRHRAAAAPSNARKSVVTELSGLHTGVGSVRKALDSARGKVTVAAQARTGEQRRKDREAAEAAAQLQKKTSELHRIKRQEKQKALLDAVQQKRFAVDYATGELRLKLSPQAEPPTDAVAAPVHAPAADAPVQELSVEQRAVAERIAVARRESDPAVLHLEVSLMRDIACAFVVLAAAALLSHRAGLPQAPGLMLAGMLVGPSSPLLPGGFIGHVNEVETLSYLGPVFVLFRTGVAYAARPPVRRRLEGARCLQGMIVLYFVATFVVGAAVAQAGGKVATSLVEACMFAAGISLSSTSAVLGMVSQSGAEHTIWGHVLTEVAALQDVLVMPLLSVPAALGTMLVEHRTDHRKLFQKVAIDGALMTALGAALICGLPLLRRCQTTPASPAYSALAPLVVTGFALCVTYVFVQLDLAVGTGAVVSGVAWARISPETAVRADAAVEVLASLFGSLYLTCLGMVLSPDFFVANLGSVVSHAALILTVKTVCGAVFLWLLGFSPRACMGGGLSLGQMSVVSLFFTYYTQQFGLISRRLHLLTLCSTAVLLSLSPICGVLVAKVSQSKLGTPPSSSRLCCEWKLKLVKDSASDGQDSRSDSPDAEQGHYTRSGARLRTGSRQRESGWSQRAPSRPRAGSTPQSPRWAGAGPSICSEHHALGTADEVLGYSPLSPNVPKRAVLEAEELLLAAAEQQRNEVKK
eukprot:TRINITY_DN9414_c0_g1_i1.p1 TRINITY_DN9414_c0_g1~~TRINITY_DN9414_c0_g1_i1.p1  ORF type:complete len:1026 (+),score=389.62 TRINITY_DN9414_c0_g1_i1:70-3147(+)